LPSAKNPATWDYDSKKSVALHTLGKTAEDLSGKVRGDSG
jgi:hypothetical protein